MQLWLNASRRNFDALIGSSGADVISIRRNFAHTSGAGLVMSNGAVDIVQRHATWLLRVTAVDQSAPALATSTEIGQVLRELASLTTIPALPELEAEWTHCRKVELAFRQAGGIPPVVSLLNSSVDKETAAILLGNLSALENAQTGESIRKAGGVKALAELLNSGTDSHQTHAAFALGGLAVHAANQVPIRKAECIPQLIQLAKTGTEVQKGHATKAISGLTGAPSNTGHIIEGGGIKLLVGLALDGPSGQYSADAACALGNLATERIGCDSIREAGGIPPMIALIRNGTESQKEFAARALRKLAESKANAVQICDAGAISPLVRLVKHGTETQKEEGAFALGTLAKDDTNDAYITQLHNEGGVSPLVELLVSIVCVGRDWEDNKYASKALANLASNSKTKLTVISGLVACLSPASSRCSADQRYSVTETLDYIAEDNTNTATICEQLRSADLKLNDFTILSLKLLLGWFGETKQGNKKVLLEKLERALSPNTGKATPGIQHLGSPAKKPRLADPAVSVGVDDGDDSDDRPINMLPKNTTRVSQVPADSNRLSSPQPKRPAVPSDQSPVKHRKLAAPAATTGEAAAKRTAEAKAAYQAAATAEKQAAAAAQNAEVEEAANVKVLKEAAASAKKAAAEQEAIATANKAARVQAEKEAIAAAATAKKAAAEVAAGLKTVKEAAAKRTVQAKAAYQAATAAEKQAGAVVQNAAAEETTRVKAVKEAAAALKKTAAEHDAITSAKKAAYIKAEKETAAAAQQAAGKMEAHVKAQKAVTQAVAQKTANAKAQYLAAQASEKEAVRVKPNNPTSPSSPKPPSAYAMFKKVKAAQSKSWSVPNQTCFFVGNDRPVAAS